MIQFTKNEEEILELFRKDLFLKTTLLHMMRLLKKKSYQRVHEAAKSLEKKKILMFEKAGNATVARLSLSQECIFNLAYAEESYAFAKKIPNMGKLLDIKDIQDDIILIAGSYAKGSQTRKSDMDIAIITKGNAFEKAKILENQALTLMPQLHIQSFTEKDFIGMLLASEENFGKEIFKSHLIIKNARRYYELVKDAIDHGFKG